MEEEKTCPRTRTLCHLGLSNHLKHHDGDHVASRPINKGFRICRRGRWTEDAETSGGVTIGDGVLTNIEAKFDFIWTAYNSFKCT